MALELFPNDRKPFDILRRPFHRIKSPSFDPGLDSAIDRRPTKRPPSGDARKSGARTPADFKASGFLERILKKVKKIITPFILAAIFAIPYVGPMIVTVNEVIGMLTGTTPLDFLLDKIAEFVGKGLEGMLFDRFMRAIPSWVPVGRQGYGPKFIYEDDGTPRETNKEEEREIEGFLAGSYVLPNDPVHTQWSRFRRWAFHVEPHPAYRYLIGRGNVPHPQEDRYIANPEGAPDSTDRLEPALRIYGQQLNGSALDTPGSLECLFDIGSISKPPGDGGEYGVMFHPTWPYWPMVGDYFWAAGRWVYDCHRPLAVSQDGKRLELFPTQLNPLKALATCAFEGHHFPENPSSVPAVRFFFLATSDGGYFQFHDRKDRKDAERQAPITLRDKDYEFVVDLPPHEAGKSPYPVGHTFEFIRNSLVIRPRLLMQVQFAPFGDKTFGPAVRDDNGFRFLDERDLMPIVELLRPDNPNGRPTQAKVTIPLSKLPPPKDPKQPEAYGFVLTMGWHDPTGEEAANVVPIRVRLRQPFFYSQSGSARLHTCINGRWHSFAGKVKSVDIPNERPDSSQRGFLHVRTLFLPKDVAVKAVSSGIWLHGFGEFMEGENTVERRLKVGSLIEMKQDLKDDINRLRELRKQGVPIDDERIKTLEKALDTIDDIFDEVDDFVGESFIADWLFDIDAEQEKGDAESNRISKIARCMWLHPTPLINQPDQPMGWAEFIHSPAEEIGRVRTQSLVVSTSGLNLDRLSTAGKIEAEHRGRSAPLGVRMFADSFALVGSGNNLARQINLIRTTFGSQEKSDYEFLLELEPLPRATINQPDPVAVLLQLVRTDGKPIANASYQLTGPQALSGVTDSDGALAHENVASGDYQLRVATGESLFVSATPAVLGQRRVVVGLTR